ncbi:hypothetical protein DTO164E3_6373 [Paecilomyces variotii]|nr:hypothetical protein DTO164E3_6373 [Paecilomyces variotii]KAJ9236322.1 hypothetical protein DTO166G5_4084 [Paecilomyces variotii]KAJ9239415.1 hypothetical protein DTO169E5_4351 [Paecilomyces variotii]KAJ9259297.1 hypothetical protein DTO207G8_860 [Paecilomyces variotii]KAJ9288820.1 hypothetical protein DTO021C3_3620 [Paecilomyces variotii]
MSQSSIRHAGHHYTSRTRPEDADKREAPDGAAADGTADGAADGAGPGPDGTATHQEKSERPDGKIELTEEDCWDKLGFAFPKWKKWLIITIIFAVQVSMNFNASLYANVVTPLSSHFSISEQAARVGQMIFLVAYAFGSELWAPWSEEFGRWPIMQMSLTLVNIWQVPCSVAPNFGTIIVCRGLGGLSSAGGSVTLGMVADMWEPDEQQYAVAYIVLSSVAGSALAPIIGGFVTKYCTWHWNFWIQLILGGFVQFLHFWVPETRCSILVTREAKRRRKHGENVWSADELREKRIGIKDVMVIWARPFVMFVREPIVLCLSLLSGFSDALIFTFLASYKLVYEQWGFGPVDTGLAFIPIMIGYLMAYASFLPWIHRHCRVRERDPDALKPEARLYWLLFTAPLEPIGLFGFAWTSLGPPLTHWIAPMIFSTLIAVANYAIYMATIDYMVASYGPYSASATGGNALARDLLAGIAAMYATPMYSNIGHRLHLEWPSTILACIAIIVTIPIYIFYWWGPKIREHSRFAQTLASERRSRGTEASTCGSGTSGPEEAYFGTRSRSASQCSSRTRRRMASGADGADGAV